MIAWFRNAIGCTYIGILLLFAFAALGLFTYKDYGIAWDEPEHVYLGNITAQYALSGDQTLLTYYARNHGVAFELLLWIFNKILITPADAAAVYTLRHLITHLFFLTSCFILFLLLNDLYTNQFLSALGFLMLALTPTIYGHSFFNSKDIPFLSMFPICLYVANRLFRNYAYKYFLLLGFCCALLINIRIMGLIFPVMVLFLLPFRRAPLNDTRRFHCLKGTAIFIFTLLIALYVSWPALWRNPLDTLIYAFTSFSRYDWDYNVLFNGNAIKAAQLPRTYTITWFAINNPAYCVLLGILGLLVFAVRIISLLIKDSRYQISAIPSAAAKLLTTREHKISLLNCGIVIGSLLSIYVVRPVVYDSWRHMYYIYPSFLMMAIYGLYALTVNRKTVRMVGYGLTVASMIPVIVYMIGNHPHYHVYFNEFVSRQPEYLKRHYELDYWGVSGKQAIEYVLKSDQSERVILAFQGLPSHNLMMLSGSKNRRQIGVADNVLEADYLITNYRWAQDLSLPYPRVFSITVLNSSIMSVYKIKKT